MCARTCVFFIIIKSKTLKTSHNSLISKITASYKSITHVYVIAGAAIAGTSTFAGFSSFYKEG